MCACVMTMAFTRQPCRSRICRISSISSPGSTTIASRVARRRRSSNCTAASPPEESRESYSPIVKSKVWTPLSDDFGVLMRWVHVISVAFSSAASSMSVRHDARMSARFPAIHHRLGESPDPLSLPDCTISSPSRSYPARLSHVVRHQDPARVARDGCRSSSLTERTGDEARARADGHLGHPYSGIAIFAICFGSALVARIR